MRPAHILLTTTAAFLASTGIAHAESYYNPSNTASQSGLTSGYDLYRTIGCPGKGLLDLSCQEDPARTATAPTQVSVPVVFEAPAPVSIPAAAETPAPVNAPAVVEASAPVNASAVVEASAAAPMPAPTVTELAAAPTVEPVASQAQAPVAAGRLANPLTFIHPLAIYCPIPKQ
ncbi:MAG: hypothetical protein PHS77_07540 [Gallionellaceae bacterium]|nr:hypothetical protein [Gallionellaceae bacterium]